MFEQRAADRLAYWCARLVRLGQVDSRSQVGDALLDYLETGDIPGWMAKYEEEAGIGPFAPLMVPMPPPAAAGCGSTPLDEIYVLTSDADNYHGGFQIHAWHDNPHRVRDEVTKRQKENEPCSECGQSKTWGYQELPKLLTPKEAIDNRTDEQNAEAKARFKRELMERLYLKDSPDDTPDDTPDLVESELWKYWRCEECGNGFYAPRGPQDKSPRCHHCHNPKMEYYGPPTPIKAYGDHWLWEDPYHRYQETSRYIFMKQLDEQWEWKERNRLKQLLRMQSQKQELSQVCAKCGRTLGLCDGRLWRVNNGKDRFEVCTSETEVHDGERVYEHVIGHGNSCWLPVEPVLEGDDG